MALGTDVVTQAAGNLSRKCNVFNLFNEEDELELNLTNPWNVGWHCQKEGFILVEAARAPRRPTTTPSESQAEIARRVAIPQIKTSYQAIGLTTRLAPGSMSAQKAPHSDEVEKELMTSRGSTTTENYTFTTVLPFLEENGDAGLALLQTIIRRGDTVPQSTRYYLPMILGYVENENIKGACRAILYSLRHSADRVVRAGAADGIDYLESI